MASIVTAKIILEKRVTLKDGTHPVKLRITYKRKQKYYTLKSNKFNELKKHSFTLSEFQKIISKNARSDNQYIQKIFNSIVNSAYDVIDSITDFKFKKFEDVFFSDDSIDVMDIFSAYKTYLNHLKESERLGTYDSYYYSMRALKLFTGKEKLAFEDIDAKFLLKFENWMLKEEKSKTSVGIYLRCVRSLYNRAINKGHVNRELYPFGRMEDEKYQIPIGRNIKRALPTIDVKRMYEVELNEGSPLERARDIWVFSYLCNGIAIGDIAKLKYKNIKGDFIEYDRKKTIKTAKQIKPIVAYFTPELKAIIDKYGNNESKSSDDYIFPVLTNEMNAIEQRKRIKQFTKNINTHLKKLATKLEINLNLTSYSARHSFATVLMRRDISPIFISKSLGHKDIKTTQSYLDSFEGEAIKEKAGILTDFKDVVNKKT